MRMEQANGVMKISIIIFLVKPTVLDLILNEEVIIIGKFN